MPLESENGAPVASDVEVQTEQVEKPSEPTLTETQETEGEKPEVEGEKKVDKTLEIKKRLEKRIDRLTYKASKLEEELASYKARESSSGESQQLTRDQFDSEDEYLDAVLEARQAKREAQEKETKFKTRVSEVIELAEDEGVDIDAFAKLPVSQIVAQAIVDSDAPVKLLEYLTENPAEAKRIHALSDARQAVEIGKIELKLSEGEPKKPAKTAAPAPISPVTGSAASKGGYKIGMSPVDYAKMRGSKIFSSR